MSGYIHGFSGAEQARLVRLNGWINPECLRAIGPRTGERALDVGCGLGILAREIAERTGAPVVAVDREPRQLAAPRARGPAGPVEFREGEATALPLRAGEWGAFDLVHARFLLEHLPDPLAAVREMVRAARPGGRVVLLDDDHELLRLWPEPAEGLALWRAYWGTYAALGNDPLVGRKLVTLLRDAGAKPSRSGFVFFGSCAGSPIHEVSVTNLLGLLEGARDEILRPGGLDEAAYRRGLDSLRTWADREDAAFWFPICWAEGVRP